MACMILWLSIFFEIRCIAVYRNDRTQNRFLKDLLSQKRHIGGVRANLSISAQPAFKNYAENSSGYYSST
jgi:hypothetical protein